MFQRIQFVKYSKDLNQPNIGSSSIIHGKVL